VFRVHFNLTADDLAAPAAELWFGRIEGDGVVYVNGTRVGASGDAHAASAYSVKGLLHPGENTVAIGIVNWGESTGPRQGTAVRFIRDGVAGNWSRSVFNGYAQVIVESTREPGIIKLTAHAAGLEDATVELKSERVDLPPTLP
jgi:beta-galactosidase